MAPKLTKAQLAKKKVESAKRMAQLEAEATMEAGSGAVTRGGKGSSGKRKAAAATVAEATANAPKAAKTKAPAGAPQAAGAGPGNPALRTPKQPRGAADTAAATTGAETTAKVLADLAGGNSEGEESTDYSSDEQGAVQVVQMGPTRAIKVPVGELPKPGGHKFININGETWHVTLPAGEKAGDYKNGFIVVQRGDVHGPRPIMRNSTLEDFLKAEGTVEEMIPEDMLGVGALLQAGDYDEVADNGKVYWKGLRELGTMTEKDEDHIMDAAGSWCRMGSLGFALTVLAGYQKRGEKTMGSPQSAREIKQARDVIEMRHEVNTARRARQQGGATWRAEAGASGGGYAGAAGEGTGGFADMVDAAVFNTGELSRLVWCLTREMSFNLKIREGQGQRALGRACAAPKNQIMSDVFEATAQKIRLKFPDASAGAVTAVITASGDTDNIKDLLAGLAGAEDKGRFRPAAKRIKAIDDTTQIGDYNGVTGIEDAIGEYFHGVNDARLAGARVEVEKLAWHQLGLHTQRIRMGRTRGEWYGASADVLHEEVIVKAQCLALALSAMYDAVKMISDGQGAGGGGGAGSGGGAGGWGGGGASGGAWSGGHGGGWNGGAMSGGTWNGGPGGGAPPPMLTTGHPGAPGGGYGGHHMQLAVGRGAGGTKTAATAIAELGAFNLATPGQEAKTACPFLQTARGCIKPNCRFKH
jgi:hypothetical protein